jgi:tetratricopeptide (TPR) repeat protein
MTICPKCNAIYSQAKNFCGKCGVPLITGTTVPVAQGVITQTAADEPTEEIPLVIPKSDKTSIFVGIILTVLITVGGYFGYDYFIVKRGFIGKIDSALADGRYFAPPGDNVEEIYRAKEANSPDSRELKEAANKIMVKFGQEGDTAFQNFYNESDDTGWDNVVKIYAFLIEIMPEDNEILARAAFSKAHEIIRGRGESNYSEALSLYQKALQLKPNWVIAINGIAKGYVRKDSPYYNKNKAINWYNRACEADPNFPWAYTNIAAIYSEDRQWEMAEQFLLNALNLKRNRPSILADLGNVCEKQNKKQEAINYYQEALKYEENPEKIDLLQKKVNGIS